MPRADRLGKLLSPLRYASGASARAWQRRAEQERGLTAVLCYHRVIEGTGRRAAGRTVGEGVPVETFEAQMRFMLRHFQPVSASMAMLLGDEAGLRFAVTFDDGYIDNLRVAAPVLRRLGIPATFYVVSNYVGTDRRFWWDEMAWLMRHTRRATLQPADFLPPELQGALTGPLDVGSEPTLLDSTAQLEAMLRSTSAPVVEATLARLRAYADARAPAASGADALMDWEDLRTLVKQGFDIGSHSSDHLNLASLDDNALTGQLVQSKRHIEAETGQAVRSIAYPYGGADHFNPAVLAGARRAGYDLAFTALDGLISRRSDSAALSRFCLNWPWGFACAHNVDQAMKATP